MGLFTNKEFAQWRGVSQTSITSHKVKYLKELSSYAEWHKQGRKVYIDKVIDPIYQPKRKENLVRMAKYFDKEWKPGKPDTCKHVAQKIVRDCERDGEPLNLASRTVYNNIVRIRTEEYGHPFKERGQLGRCIYVLCKQIDEDYELFTDDQRRLKDRLLKLYFGDVTEKALMTKLMVEDGEIEKDQAWQYFEDISSIGRKDKYVCFLNDLEEKIGEKVARATLLLTDETQESAF